MRVRGAVTLGAAGLAMSLAAVPARADLTKDECIDANGKGQDLVHDGKLAAARVQLQSCVASSCPAVIRDDCTKRLDELDKTQPAIVFVARDAGGNDLSAVSVTMDGAALTAKLDGTPLRVDPGEHVFVFTATGQATVTKKLVLAVRDQTRKERIQFEAAPSATPLAAPAPAPAPSTDTGPAASTASPAGMSSLRRMGLVTGGVGVVGLGVGSVFGLMTGSAWNAQKNDCASSQSCSNHGSAVSDHSTLTTDSTISTVGFVAGGVLLAAGVTMYFLGGSSGEQPSATGLVVAPGLAPGGGGVSVRGAF